MNHSHGAGGLPRTSGRYVLVLLGFVAISAVLLLSEHRLLAYPVIVVALLFMCPLLHVLMHGGHDSGGHGPPTRPGIRGPGGTPAGKRLTQ